MSHRKAALIFMLVTAAAAADAAPVYHNVNAAEIGTGVRRNINWNDESLQTPVWCGSACSYLEVSTAKIAPDSLFTYNPTAWPGTPSSTNVDAATVSRATYTPVNTVDSQGREIVYDTPYYERGAIENTLAGRALVTRVFQSGNQPTGGTGTAAAAVAYHVKVQNQSSGSRDYFIKFTAPKPTGGMGVPYNVGGPSGNQPINVSQKKYAKSRSAVDVLVDGLPVWSTSSSYVIPEEPTSSSSYAGFAVDFGYASDNDFYTVFLGRFASADTFDLDFVVRAESLSRAPTCGKVNESSLNPNPRSFIHCLNVSEGRTLPPASGPDGHFEIYSKDVSTPYFQLPPGGLGSTPL